MGNLLEEEKYEHNLKVCCTFPTNAFPLRMYSCFCKTFINLFRLDVSAQPLSESYQISTKPDISANSM